MTKPTTIDAYFDGLEGQAAIIAQALRALIEKRWPHLKAKPAWGFPCWSANERVLSIIAHTDRCNLQLWSGARLANTYRSRIEGTGKALRHVKVRSLTEIDDELIDIIERAVELDMAAPQRVR